MGNPSNEEWPDYRTKATKVDEGVKGVVKEAANHYVADLVKNIIVKKWYLPWRWFKKTK